MPNYYTVYEVKPEWKLDDETMGSKKKFWYLQSGENQKKWLFKYPKENTGQHWAEKLAEQVADVLEIEHAKVELATFQGECGSVTESFTQDDKELDHGNQMLEAIVYGYNPDKKFGQSHHTLENILRAIDGIFNEDESVVQAKLCIAEYIILDALIGNTDRHHENWGILRNRKGDPCEIMVAPSFDHESSLGRELLDSRRDMLLKESRIGNYVKNGRGGIYWSENEKPAPSPMKLVTLAAQAYPEFFIPALRKLQNLDNNTLENIVNCIPASWMTSSARLFAIELMHHNLRQLKRLTQ